MSKAFADSYRVLNKNERRKKFNKLQEEYNRATTSNMRRLQIERELDVMAKIEGQKAINIASSNQQLIKNATLMANAQNALYSYHNKTKLGGNGRRGLTHRKRGVLARKGKSLRRN